MVDTREYAFNIGVFGVLLLFSAVCYGLYEASILAWDAALLLAATGFPFVGLMAAFVFSSYLGYTEEADKKSKIFAAKNNGIIEDD